MAASPHRSHPNRTTGTAAGANSGGNEEEGRDGSGAAKRTSRGSRGFASIPFDGEARVFPSSPLAVGVFGYCGGGEDPEASRLRVVDEPADPRSGNYFLASSGNLTSLY